MTHEIDPDAVQKLLTRDPLPVDPGRSIAVKRDVHEFEVDAPPSEVATAFREVMTDPTGTFGLIRVKRPKERLGKPFTVGERFQGCFSLDRALLGAVTHGWRKTLFGGAVRWLLRRSVVRWLVGKIEDAMLSDYAEIEELVMEPDMERGEIHRLKYRYLVGTPIAGSSRFLIERLDHGRCRVVQIFEYQEINWIALSTFQRIGLKMHDQVVHMQVQKTAQRLGIGPPRGTIPVQYANL